MLQSREDYGLDINDYVDTDSLFESAIDMDGVGNALNSYDGGEYESSINGTWYHVVRVE